MKIKFAISIAAILGAAIFFPAVCQAKAKTSPAIAHSMIRLEMHDDPGNPDDYIYKMFSVTKQLENRVIGNVYYIYKHNLETNGTGGHVAGANVMRTFGSRVLATLGYYYTVTERTSVNPDKTDKDRFLLAVNYTPYKTKAGSRINLSSSYNTQTDFVESKTIDAGISYTAAITKRLSATAGYKYNYVLSGIDMHLLDIWNADISYKASKKTTIDAGYMFVDKVFDVPAGVVVEDDNIFRLGVKYRYF